MLWVKRGLNSKRFNVLPVPRFHEVAVSIRQVLASYTPYPDEKRPRSCRFPNNIGWSGRGGVGGFILPNQFSF